ncbi:DUF3221 domain-containing protein [Paenibacillus larvae]|uniref:DUF3221 domain-containing protein n=4 Tax=Paenibacillus larvae TaxID=1464 RepID=V9W786_9BACL|nr:hypothetical protein [Paenibacillus larvae]AHD06013.1 hypothetical protein ERIC2_c22190 [Paenibacillus larvae subsp. larvae DSM 25430]AQR76485.1 DUF3221 domain-containing protein [Paenibacillus larvae subsp. larvae]AQT83687.1 DUF3221 domain-containing protein [Paenibacillus larvae subsp. pulvifaciens]AQZ48833.1 DUF3221 domain-containing protein [Paenibacillus larvae subsp. pulvifaciens]ARF69870.1 DUF3221 domain-containing protein [Paenibacillus larvae subsp. pulvifaciens]
MITKKKLVAVATSLTLGLGFAAGASPTFAHSDDTLSPSVSSVEKQDQIQFTGYITSIGDVYATVVNASTKEEALQGNWVDLVNQNKVLLVPLPQNEKFVVGDKVNVFYQVATLSIPPIALPTTIEKISE